MILGRLAVDKAYQAEGLVYERCGFASSPIDPMTLMITVADAEKALSGK